MAENESEQNKSFLKRYDTVISFLGVEIIALIFFGLGGATGLSVLKILGVLLAIWAFPFVSANFDKKAIQQNALRLLPLWVFFLLLGFSAFWFSYYSSNAFYGVLNGILQFVGLCGLFMLGFVLKNVPVLRREYVIGGILAALALFVLITGVYSLCRYGFFYAAQYSGKVYYYDGVVFPVASETKTLQGFSLVEASLSYGKTAAFLLASSGAGLFFYHQDKKKALILAGLALLGVLDMVFVPFTKGLLLLLGVYAVVGLVRLFLFVFRGKEKAGKLFWRIVWVVLMVVVALGLAALFVDAKTGFLQKAGIPRISASLASDDSFLGKIRRTIQDVMFGGASNKDLGKISWLTLFFGYNKLTSVHFPSSFEFTILYENGLFAFLLLLVIIFAAMKVVGHYLKKGGFDVAKGAIVALIFGAFVYLSLMADEMPLVHASSFLPVTQSGAFLGVFFLLGYVYEPEVFTKKKGDAHE